VGVVDEADHRGSHGSDGGSEGQVAEHPLGSGRLGGPGVALSGEVEVCPPGTEADHDAASPTLRVTPLIGWLASPATTPVRVSPSTMIMSVPNRSMSASVTVSEVPGLAVRITAANTAR
jgi:hypothetical protein